MGGKNEPNSALDKSAADVSLACSSPFFLLAAFFLLSIGPTNIAINFHFHASEGEKVKQQNYLF